MPATPSDDAPLEDFPAKIHRQFAAKITLSTDEIAEGAHFALDDQEQMGNICSIDGTPPVTKSYPHDVHKTVKP